MIQHRRLQFAISGDSKEDLSPDIWLALADNGFADGKRIRNAEFLIHSNIEIKFISEFIVFNPELKIKFEKILEKKNIKIPVNKDLDFSYFFQV